MDSNVWRNLAGVLGLALIAMAVYPLVETEYHRPVTKIEVFGERKWLTDDKLESIIRQALAGKNYWNVNLQTVDQALEQSAWIEKAAVERIGLGELRVRVSEQEPIARWNTANLINKRGEVFSNQNRYHGPKLPRLAGPDAAIAVVVSYYVDMATVCRELKIPLESLQMTASGSVEAQVGKKVSVNLGAQEIAERILRFSLLWDTIDKRERERVASVDMRYDNAAALAWRSNDKFE